MRSLALVLLLSLSPLPAAAGGLALSLPPESAVKVGAPSRLTFRVTNEGAQEGLSRLTLGFTSGYRVTRGSAPAGWTVEGSPAAGQSGEISFRTEDEAKCKGAIAPGHSLVFGVEVIAPASAAVTPDRLVGAQGEQTCRGVALDPPATLPSWDRLGIEAALAAQPTRLGVGGEVTVTMTVTNLSTIPLTDIAPLLRSSGTGSVSGLQAPTPATLTLAPGASGSMTWTGRAASAGTVSFGGQAVSRGVASPPVRAEPLFVGDLEVSLEVAPEHVLPGQDVEVRMTVTNRGPFRVANVIPSGLTFEGTALASAAAGPSPASLTVLDPGQSASFAWAATIAGKAGETYAFSGWASAEWDSVVSQGTRSNRGVLAQEEAKSEPDKDEGSHTVGGGSASDVGAPAVATTATTTGSPAPPASATVQFIGVDNNGTLMGGTTFSGGLLRELRVLVSWQNVPGSHTQRLELFSPSGSLYQRLSTQFATSSAEGRLPVGGTWITEFSLFGAWRVDVYLDGQAMPITTGAFILNP